MQLSSHRGRFVSCLARFVQPFCTAQTVQFDQLKYRGQVYSVTDSPIVGTATEVKYSGTYRGVSYSVKSFSTAHSGERMQLQYRGTQYAR